MASGTAACGVIVKEKETRTNTYLIIVLFQVIGVIDPGSAQAQCEGVCTSDCITACDIPACCPEWCPAGGGNCFCDEQPAACAGSDQTIS